MTSLFLLERYERCCVQWFQLAITANACLKGQDSAILEPVAMAQWWTMTPAVVGERGGTGNVRGAEAGTIRTSVRQNRT